MPLTVPLLMLSTAVTAISQMKSIRPASNEQRRQTSFDGGHGRSSSEKDDLKHDACQDCAAIGRQVTTITPATAVGRKRAGDAYDDQINLDGSCRSLRGIAMYGFVYWRGVTLIVVWSVFSAFSALSGL